MSLLGLPIHLAVRAGALDPPLARLEPPQAEPARPSTPAPPPLWRERLLLASAGAGMVTQLLFAGLAWGLAGGDPVLLIFATMVPAAGTVAALALCVARRRERARHARQLAELWESSTRDDLTGLRNRRYFRERLDELVAMAGPPPVVALLDVDDFKGVNDSFGHGAGDFALRHFASLLEITLADSAEAARLGGDEFGLLFRGRSMEEAEQDVLLFLAVLDASPVMLGLPGRRVHLGASFGLARGEPGEPSALLLARADSDLYRSKAAHRFRAS